MIIGRLGRDPELKKTNSGKSICTLSVVTGKKNKNGKDYTEWHSVIVWEKDAENCAKFLKKGSLAYFEGQLQTRSWDKDGQKRYVTEISASSVQFLGTKPDNETESVPKQEKYDDVSEIPF